MSTALADTSLAVAVDIGGTFTDIALYDAKSGQIWRAKTPSVPGDPSQAFLTGMRLALEDAGRAAPTLGRVLHGTTVATNMILEGKGAQDRAGDDAGLPPCAGDRPPGHPAPRQLPRLGEAAAPGAGLARARGQGAHRRRRRGHRGARRGERRRPRPKPAASSGSRRSRSACCIPSPTPRTSGGWPSFCAPALPGVAVTASSDVLPVVREYERSLATVLNALVMPGVATYVSRLEDRLAEEKVERAAALHAVERRRRRRRHHPPRAGADGAVGPGGGRGRRARRGRRRAASRTSSPSISAAPAPTSA